MDTVELSPITVTGKRLHPSSFQSRELSMQFTLLKDGQTFSDKTSDTIDLSGFRCRAHIESSAVDLALGRLTLQIFGMKMADMVKLSTDGYRPFEHGLASIALSAGNKEKGMYQIYKGTVMSGHIDINMPEASIILMATPSWEASLTNNPPNSYKGEVDVASLMESLAKQMNHAFINNGVTKKVRNPYYTGSIKDQLKTIAESTQTICVIENDTVTIWNNGSARDDITIELSPETGLIGYPTFDHSFIILKSIFNPNFILGSRINVVSDFEKANGITHAFQVIHEISTLEDNAPWFTTIFGQKDTWFGSQN